MDFSQHRDKTEQVHGEQVEQILASPTDTALIGDSYFHRLTWVDGHEHLLQGYSVLAVGGDRMEHLAWRLERLPAEFSFKRIFLFIGLNNIMYGMKLDRHLRTLDAIISYICQRFPEAEVTVLDYPIYPSAKVDRVTTLNAALEGLPTLSTKAKLLRPWAGLSPEMFCDDVHLNLAGYRYLFSHL